jgi:hypothetical protein
MRGVPASLGELPPLLVDAELAERNTLPRVQFKPGALFTVPAGEASAYAVMLAEFPFVAFYPADVAFGDDGEPVGAPMFVVSVARGSYSTGKWGRPLRVLPPGKFIPIPRFFTQSMTSKGVCKIIDPAAGRTITVGPQDCVGLEHDAVWSSEHIESRIIDTYAERPNLFTESLKLRL